MKIQVNTHSSVEGSDALSRVIKTTVHSALDRYGDRLTRVEVHLSHDDSASGDSYEAVQCMLEARPTGMDPVVATAVADTLEQACHDAGQKMQSVLDRTFGRIDARDAGATIRQGRR